MTHKDSICFKCLYLFDYGRLFRKDEIVAVCLKHYSRNAGNRQKCKDFEFCGGCDLKNRENILREGEDYES